MGVLEVSKPELDSVWQEAKVLFYSSAIPDGRARAYLNFGQYFERQEKWDSAIKQYEKCLAQKPIGLEMRCEANYKLGSCLIQCKRFNDAELHCLLAAMLGETDSKLHIYFGQIYLAQGRVLDAALAFAEAIKNNSGDEIAPKLLSELLARRSDLLDESHHLKLSVSRVFS